ncbi:hypothetical protein [Aeromicrobium piscarium]|uniref:Uncharacterized protein n=1 Tax=Aeromicrobium piscarium TaxID=2590901 RepID=A0A554SP44_9ACTN|nr:hypothetical protein [Aeromicrobium piscarium]TSD68132.1 hypothetical protein FNM00_00610 [Aeromicrobium piscarium]
MSQFIDVYAKSTGEKHRVPAHFMDVPSIAKQFTKTPRQRKADERAAARQSEPVASNQEAAQVAEDQTPDAGDKKE